MDSHDDGAHVAVRVAWPLQDIMVRNPRVAQNLINCTTKGVDRDIFRSIKPLAFPRSFPSQKAVGKFPTSSRLSSLVEATPLLIKLLSSLQLILCRLVTPTNSILLAICAHSPIRTCSFLSRFRSLAVFGRTYVVSFSIEGLRLSITALNLAQHLARAVSRGVGVLGADSIQKSQSLVESSFLGPHIRH